MRRRFAASVGLGHAIQPHHQGGSVLWMASCHYGGRVPNKGYRTQPTVPDRLKDTVEMFGTDTRSLHPDKDPPYVPEDQRRRVALDVMNSHHNMKSHKKLDRLQGVIERLHNRSAAVDAWNEVYLFLRTTEMCTELEQNLTDVFSEKGKKLWIELEQCEERRLPYLLELPNGMLVLPIFSMEEYLDHYFSRLGIFESCWFPSPRMGSQWEVFCSQSFPVCATGNLQRYSAMATQSLEAGQFAVLLNPGQRGCKFITYPEMVEMTKMARLPMKERNPVFVEVAEHGELEATSIDSNLMVLFNSEKLPVKRVAPNEVAGKLAVRPKLPPIAQMELHLLLFRYKEIAEVHIRSVDRAKWRQMLGAPEKATQIDVVAHPGTKPPPTFFDHLKRWSFLKEFDADVHVELTAEAPPEDAASMLVYTSRDGEMLRKMITVTDMTLAESLGYNEPLVDEAGRDVYDR